MRPADTEALSKRVGRSRATIYRWAAEGMPEEFGAALTWVARHHPSLLGAEDSAFLVEHDDRQQQIASKFGAGVVDVLRRFDRSLGPDDPRATHLLACAMHRLVEETAGLPEPSWGWECPLPAGPIGEWVSGSPPPAAGEESATP